MGAPPGVRRTVRLRNSVLSVADTWSLDTAPLALAVETDTAFSASACTTHCVDGAGNLSRQTFATCALLPEEASVAPMVPSVREVATPVVRSEPLMTLAAARFCCSEPPLDGMPTKPTVAETS